MSNWIFNNHVFPLRFKNLRIGHIFLYIIILLVIFLHIAAIPVTTDTNDLYITAGIEMENRGVKENKLNKASFNKRVHNLWANLIYYQKYSKKLVEYFDVIPKQIQIDIFEKKILEKLSRPKDKKYLLKFFEKNISKGVYSLVRYLKKDEKPRIYEIIKSVNFFKSKLPKPVYPLISNRLKPFLGYQIFPPYNTVEIATFLRKNLGSGITIRTKDMLVDKKSVKGMDRKQLISNLVAYKQKLNQYFKVVVDGSQNGKPLSNTFFVNYKDFPDFSSRISTLIKNHVKLEKVSLYSNQKAFHTTKDKKKPKDTINKNSSLIITKSLRSLKQNEIIESINEFKDKTARIFTLVLQWKKAKQTFEKPFFIRFNNFPKIQRILDRQEYRHLKFDKILLYESKVLKHKPNSREFVDHTQIPEKIRTAFILVEDDYFYFQAGGVDPIGLIKASYDYITKDLKKGNASIIEQIYEMYLGKQNKAPFDKFVQILGANYLSFYAKSRDPFVNLYIQSIPGSFWRDHNYGIKGIIKNYLNKDSLEDISQKELAWLTRIALLPNVFGQDYIRFHILKKELKEQNIDIFNNNQLKKFLEKNKKTSIRLAKESSKSDLEVVARLRRSYDHTNIRIKTALNQFLKGNEFIKPIISKKEYDIALKDEVNFTPSRFVNEYQSYTDQTKKDLYQYVGAWGLNAGLDVEVDFDEEAQKILEEELLHSTRTVYNFRYDHDAKHKRYGGASVLVKTHNIKTGEIVNKIVAIASKHTGKSYFNWAVDGRRHFGSIFKWVALLLYLDEKGTLLDTFYDIPRTFKFQSKNKKGKMATFEYKPNNWKRHRDDTYGYFTFDRRNNIYNFVQSKNNTFVRIAELVGLKQFSDFLNLASGLEKMKNKHRKFQAIFPVVLGSQETSSIRFAQINAIIPNQGTFQPLTTITRLIEPEGHSLKLDLSSERIQVASREAAELAFFCGYLNTYFGTAKRFISGGAGKTGSSDTDVAFLAMTARTEKEYIKNNKDHLLNNNLLYLVNIGVNEGKIDEGLFGGTVAAINAKAVFEKLLKYEYVGRVKKPRYKIAGNFTQYFSDEFDFKRTPSFSTLNGKVLLIPMLKNRKVNHEPAISAAKIEEIRIAYEGERDEKASEDSAEQMAEADGYNFSRLPKTKQEEYREIARLDRENQQLDAHYMSRDSYSQDEETTDRSNKRRSQNDRDYIEDFEDSVRGSAKKKDNDLNDKDDITESYLYDNEQNRKKRKSNRQRDRLLRKRIIRVESKPNTNESYSESDFLRKLEREVVEDMKKRKKQRNERDY